MLKTIGSRKRETMCKIVLFQSKGGKNQQLLELDATRQSMVNMAGSASNELFRLRKGDTALVRPGEYDNHIFSHLPGYFVETLEKNLLEKAPQGFAYEVRKEYVEIPLAGKSKSREAMRVAGYKVPEDEKDQEEDKDASTPDKPEKTVRCICELVIEVRGKKEESPAEVYERSKVKSNLASSALERARKK